MNDEECRRASFGVSKRFLMKFKLLGVDGGVCPLQCAQGFHILVLIHNNDNVSAKCFLHHLHPMSMNDTGCHFEYCQSSIDKTELEYFRSHFQFVCISICYNGGVASDMLSCLAVLSLADWRLGLKTEEGFNMVEGAVTEGYTGNP
jgi:hypothetical protein